MSRLSSSRALLWLSIVLLFGAGLISESGPSLAADGTALFERVSLNDVAGIKALLDGGADPNAKNAKGLTPLAMAVNWKADDKKREWVFPRRADGVITTKSPQELAKLLLNVDVVKLLLERGADPNAKDKDGVTPLMFAVQEADRETVEAVRLLLKHGGDAKAMDRVKRTPLTQAVRTYATESSLDIVAQLLAVGADPNAGAETPLWIVANAYREGGKPSAATVQEMKLLLDHGADPNARNDDGSTPLNGAAKAEANPARLEMVKLLLQRGADPLGKDEYGRSVLHDALGGYPPPSAQKVEIVDLLLKRGADPLAKDARGGIPLRFAARLVGAPGSEIFKLLLSRVPNPPPAGLDSTSLLLEAMEGQGNPEIVKLLLERGADLNGKDSSGRTPLHFAVTNFHSETAIAVIKLLLERGADPLAKDSQNMSPAELMRDKLSKDPKHPVLQAAYPLLQQAELQAQLGRSKAAGSAAGGKAEWDAIVWFGAAKTPAAGAELLRLATEQVKGDPSSPVSPNFPSLVRSDDMEGMKPGYYAVVLGFCRPEETASRMEYLKTRFHGEVYARRVRVAAAASSCPPPPEGFNKASEPEQLRIAGSTLVLTHYTVSAPAPKPDEGDFGQPSDIFVATLWGKDRQFIDTSHIVANGMDGPEGIGYSCTFGKARVSASAIEIPELCPSHFDRSGCHVKASTQTSVVTLQAGKIRVEEKGKEPERECD